MFPFDLEDENLEEEDEKIFREYEIDFETGQLTGRIVEGLEAVKAWVYLALRTARYRFQQYSWNYGSEFENLIGMPQDKDYVESEIQRMVEDCLKINKHIQGIDELSCSFDDGVLIASFTLITDYGEVEINV